MSVIIPAPVAQRAATRFVVAAGCHNSTYSVGSHGYAQVGWSVNGRRYATTAHRAAWVHHHGEQVPDGLTVDHLCKNRTCVNPDHLRVLPNLENARRTHGMDWPLGTCRHGHSPAWWRPKGPTRAKGYCHACRMARQRLRRGTTSPRRTYP